MLLHEVNENMLEVLENELISEEAKIDTMDALMLEQEYAIESLANWITEREAIEKQESEVLSKRRDALMSSKKKTSYWKEYLMNTVKSRQEVQTQLSNDKGLRKFNFGDIEIRFRKSSKAIVDDMDKLPDEFIKKTIEPRTRDLKAFLKDNGDTDYAHIDNGFSGNIY